MAHDAKDDHREPGEKPSPWEWVVGALGLALVVAAVWVLLMHGPDGPDRPPDVVLRATAVHRVSSGWLVVIEAENRGDESATTLLVEGELSRAGQPPERAETQFDFLPSRSRRTAGLHFSSDPASGALRLRPVGYQAP